MTIAFSHEVGFYGVVFIDGVQLLATSGSVNLNTEPMYSSGVWGAGWYNAAEQVAYAVNYMRIEGDVGFELTKGDTFTKLKEFAFTKRADPLRASDYFQILPQGKSGYIGPAWCSGCNFTASENALVTGGFNYSSGKMDANSWVTGVDQTYDGGLTSESALGVAGGLPFAATDVYPYWASKVSIGSTVLTVAKLNDVISWSANYSSQINYVAFCNGQTSNVKEADYIMVGPMTADGSLTIFKVSSQLDPDTFQSVKAAVISMAPQSDLATPNTITLANLVYNSGSTSIQTGGGYIQADISFTALGDGTQPPMSLA